MTVERIPLNGKVDFTMMYVAHDAFTRDVHRMAVPSDRGLAWTPETQGGASSSSPNFRDRSSTPSPGLLFVPSLSTNTARKIVCGGRKRTSARLLVRGCRSRERSHRGVFDAQFQDRADILRTFCGLEPCRS